MTARFPDDSSKKAAVSVAEMARTVGMSRNHFWSLCKRGVFPMPAYSTANKRPYFDIAAQQACLQVRQTNIGHDGLYVIFYGPRRKTEAEVSRTSSGGKAVKVKASDRATTLAKALKHLGLDVTGQQVDAATPEVFPQGLPAEDGAAIRAFFLHFKKALSS